MELLSLFNEGGFIMIPLLICSIAVWAVAVEKIWFLKQFRAQYIMLHKNATGLLAEDKVNEAKGLGHSVHSLISTPYNVLFDERSNKTKWEDRVGRRLVETQQGLKKNLWIIGTVGASAPFIGLFGTVVGIIKSFDSIAVSGKSGFAVVAAGLSEALIATAAGIIVAIIAVMFYNFFQNKLSYINTDFKHRLEDLMDLIN